MIGDVEPFLPPPFPTIHGWDEKRGVSSPLPTHASVSQDLPGQGMEAPTLLASGKESY